MTELRVFFKLWHIRCNITVKKKNNRKYEARLTTTKLRNASKTLDTNKNNTRRASDIDDDQYVSTHNVGRWQEPQQEQAAAGHHPPIQ